MAVRKKNYGGERRGILITMEHLVRMRKLPWPDLGELMAALIDHVRGLDLDEDGFTSKTAEALFPYVRDEVDWMEAEYQRKRHNSGAGSNSSAAGLRQDCGISAAGMGQTDNAGMEQTDSNCADNQELINNTQKHNIQEINSQENNKQKTVFDVFSSPSVRTAWDRYIKVREGMKWRTDDNILKVLQHDLQEMSEGDPAMAEKMLRAASGENGKPYKGFFKVNGSTPDKEAEGRSLRDFPGLDAIEEEPRDRTFPGTEKET